MTLTLFDDTSPALFAFEAWPVFSCLLLAVFAMPFDATPLFELDAPRSTSHIRVVYGARPVRVCSNKRLSEKSGKMKPFRFELPLLELLLLIIYV